MNLFDFKEVSSKKLSFETLYVYEIEKSMVLRELEAKCITEISYLTHGKRGNIFTGKVDRSKLIKTHFPSKKDVLKVAIKIKRKESKAIARIENEVKWLKLLNKGGIGPRLMFSTDNYFVYKFVEGEFILDWLLKSEKEAIRKVLVDLLKQCKKLDDLNVNKEEMHHPQKHILITNNNFPVMLDFERCHITEKPSNVTQFIEFICRIEGELVKKDFNISVSKLRELAKKYKDSYSGEVFKEIVFFILN
jgi:putative serine/threonine protein kinase